MLRYIAAFRGKKNTEHRVCATKGVVFQPACEVETRREVADSATRHGHGRRRRSGRRSRVRGRVATPAQRGGGHRRRSGCGLQRQQLPHLPAAAGSSCRSHRRRRSVSLSRVSGLFYSHQLANKPAKKAQSYRRADLCSA